MDNLKELQKKIENFQTNFTELEKFQELFLYYLKGIETNRKEVDELYNNYNNLVLNEIRQIESSRISIEGSRTAIEGICSMIEKLETISSVSNENQKETKTIILNLNSILEDIADRTEKLNSLQERLNKVVNSSIDDLNNNFHQLQKINELLENNILIIEQKTEEILQSYDLNIGQKLNEIVLKTEKIEEHLNDFSIGIERLVKENKKNRLLNMISIVIIILTLFFTIIF